jgi:NAD(P)-dependent dehydrogenase (short-subunit alcohol dehydrogenase family)
MTLAGHKIVVIGGSSGMGLATARAAALEGAEVTIASSRQDRVDAALGELPAGCVGTALDVRDEAEVASFFERLGHLDHLAFTAGDAFAPRPLADFGLSDARAVLDVRFWGAVTVIKYAAPRISPGGSIGLTTGTASDQSPAQRSPLPVLEPPRVWSGGWRSNSPPFGSTRSGLGRFAHQCGTASPRPSARGSSPAWRRAP